MNRFKFVLILSCMYFIMLPANITGELSKFQYDIIELAFTNGFLRGMSVDNDTIDELLKDKGRLNEFARKAALEYMNSVVELNLKGSEEKEPNTEDNKKKPNKTNNSIAF